MNLPEGLIRVIEVSIALYIGNRIISWFKDHTFKKPVRWEKPIEPSDKIKRLFGSVEYQLKDNEKVMIIKKGFCSNHPEETQLVLGPKINDCIQCLREGKNKARR